MVEGQNLCFKTLKCAFRPTTFKQMQLFSALSGTWWISLWTSPDVRFLGRHNGVIYVPARAGAHWNLRPNVVPTKTDPLVCGVTTSLSKGTPPDLPVSSSTRHWKPSCEKIQHHLRCFQGSPVPWKIKFLSEAIQTF